MSVTLPDGAICSSSNSPIISVANFLCNPSVEFGYFNLDDSVPCRYTFTFAHKVLCNYVATTTTTTTKATTTTTSTLQPVESCKAVVNGVSYDLSKISSIDFQSSVIDSYIYKLAVCKSILQVKVASTQQYPIAHNWNGAIYSKISIMLHHFQLII